LKGVTRKILWRLTVLWIVLVTVVALSPSEAKVFLGTETRSQDPAVRAHAAVVHRRAHFFSFGLAALLLAVLSRSRWAVLVRGLLVIAWGLAIESTQHVLFGSVFETWDVRDDSLSAIAGCGLGCLPVIRRFLIKHS
jgi:hypothetical protein